MLTKEQIKNNRKWIKALRSGRYEQGISRLRTDDSYCCLGVACDISGLGKWVGTTHLPRYRIGHNEEDRSGFLSLPSLRKYYGCDSAGFTLDSLGKDMITLNDQDRWSFEQIADALQKYIDDEEMKLYS